jgi:CRP/FNR family transcriptional regulator, cyclic AMP receptor protein
VSPRRAAIQPDVIVPTLTCDPAQRSIRPPAPIRPEEIARMTVTPDRRTALLSGAPLLAGVDQDGLEAVAARAIEVEFSAGQVIARQGDVGSGLFIVASGSVRVVRDGDTIATLGPGEFFGELSVLDGQPRTAQVVAVEPTVCLALSTWEFEAVVRDQPDVALAVMRGLAARLRGLTEAHRH